MIEKIKSVLRQIFSLLRNVEMLQQEIADLRAESQIKLEAQRQDSIKLMMHTRWLVTHKDQTKL